MQDYLIINWVQSSVCAVCSRQTVMQKDSIEVLRKSQDPLVQKASLSSLARVCRNPPSKIIKEVLALSVQKNRPVAVTHKQKVFLAAVCNWAVHNMFVSTKQDLSKIFETGEAIVVSHHITVPM